MLTMKKSFLVRIYLKLQKLLYFKITQNKNTAQTWPDVLEDYGKTLLRFDKINPHEANVVLIATLKVNRSCFVMFAKKDILYTLPRRKTKRLI